MKLLHVSGSPRQIQKLRNGHKVRVSKAIEGQGFNLIVDPMKFDVASRCFAKGKAYQIQLSPDEIVANKKLETGELNDVEGMTDLGGQTIFTGGKLSLKKVGKKIVSGLKKVDKAIKSNPVAKAVVKSAVPILAEQATTAALMSAGVDPMTAKAVSKVSSTAAKSGMKQAGYGVGEKKVSTIKKVGRTIRKVAKSELGQELIKAVKPAIKRKAHEKLAEATMKLADYADSPLKKEALMGLSQYGHERVEGMGLYAGRGLYAGAGFTGPHSRSVETTSIGIGGSLMNPVTNPALRSDPYGANFAMNTQLPIQLQKVRFV